MNELLAQFLSEARESLEGIGDKLMQLETAPDDTDLMAELFRLVHTLKGNSGLFDFPEMSKVLHAGEDLMDAVRHGRVHYSQGLADRLLDAMDFVGMLCDDIEHDRLLSDGVVSESVALAHRLRSLMGEPETPDEAHEPVVQTRDPALPGPDAATLARVPESVRLAAFEQAQAGQSLLWVRYQPDEQCFFNGEDPLHQSRMTPGVLWGGLSARQDWPALSELDAYRCLLDFELLVAASRSDVIHHFRYVPEQISLQDVHPLTLALPQGDPNGGPVYDDFVSDALGFLDQGNLAGLTRAVSSLLDLSSASLWLSSALRWVAVMLKSQPVPLDAVRKLIESLRTFTPPNWSVTLVPLAQAAIQNIVTVDQAEGVAEPSPRLKAMAEVIHVQREILALPDDDPCLAGRLKAVALALTGCLRGSGRTDDVPGLDDALEAALQARQAQPLAQWLAVAFSVDNPSPEPVLQAIPLTDAAPDAPALSEGVPTEGDSRFSRRVDDTTSVKSLKVDQVKIDRLMNLIGEMVVAKNAIPYLATRAENVFGVRELSREIKAQYAVINRISDEMQDAIMQVRMMPVSFVMQRFPRLVRDISRRLGKEVNLVLEGQETAADKNIIESLGDPLVHIVRNSLDHGLEMTNVRQSLGKPASGTIKIVAKQASDRVVIEISDDGKGIDPDVIKRKAYQKGLIDETTVDRLSDQDAINLIFAPGFSTVDVVSDLSGRGVGMDVVRTAVERVNGTIALSSVKGQGTTIRLSLPLSMAVSNVMTIAADGQLFGVPMDVVVETMRVPAKSVRRIKQGQVAVLRGRVVPLLSLNQLLGMASPPLTHDDEFAALVVRLGDETVGLLVDQFHGTADIILKPLGGVLGNLKAYAGSALMGDGSVLMVLNLKELL